MVYQVIDVSDQYCRRIFIFFNVDGSISDPEWDSGFLDHNFSHSDHENL